MDRRKFLVSSLLSSVAASALAKSSNALSIAGPQAHPQPELQLEPLPKPLRAKLMQDPYRPQFHLLPRANWMNDPCAPRFYRGQYHVFFQYNPGAAVWGDMHWAHATSADLIHWQHLPVALAPTAGSYDAFGCFTGSALPGTALPSILYTGVTKCAPADETIRGEGTREVQCLATSTDPDLRTWNKLARPVIEHPPSGAAAGAGPEGAASAQVKVTGFRDPCPWKDGDTWYLIVGSGFNKIGGAVLLYRSPDGRQWEYLHPMAQGQWNGGSATNPVDTGEMWECPDFFPLGDKHVLLYSTERKVFWEVGTLDKTRMRFHMETRGLLDHGHYYAMKSMLDEKGRRLLWGWVTEDRADEALKQAGWAGSMALPRLLSIGPDNTLRMQVPPEFDSLLAGTKTVSSPATETALTDLSFGRRAGAVVYSFEPSSGPCAVELRASGTSLLALKCAGDDGTLSVGHIALPLSPDHEGVSTVRLWFDGSVIEVFVDDREALTARSYAGADDIEVAWVGRREALQSLHVSSVRPISSDRLTS